MVSPSLLILSILNCKVSQLCETACCRKKQETELNHTSSSLVLTAVQPGYEGAIASDLRELSDLPAPRNSTRCSPVLPDDDAGVGNNTRMAIENHDSSNGMAKFNAFGWDCYSSSSSDSDSSSSDPYKIKFRRVCRKMKNESGGAALESRFIHLFASEIMPLFRR